MPFFTFTVDATLLRELGERLVGQPHIALAELIKNSYDADAKHVVVLVNDNAIAVIDDGDGMTPADFENFWMRVGSPHKQQVLRTNLGRIPTGSKGIGRLAVQFLGSVVSIRTTPRGANGEEMRAEVDWSTATKAGDLTRARVEYHKSRRKKPYAAEAPQGTEVIIRKLNQEWSQKDLLQLAQQVWQLQPPFRREDASDFRIDLIHPDESVITAFDTQLRRNLDLWSARLRGRLLPARSSDEPRVRRVQLLLEFAEEEPERHEYAVRDCDLHEVDYEIRIFSLFHKQRYGIAVEAARQYLRDYGGVHIYDGGFHLPYYGPDTDWLKTEIDHSHRLTRSQLLPEELQVDLGLNNLPTLSRVYGVVNVATSKERAAARAEKRFRLNQYLQIQASRDRLVDNPSYRALRGVVRYALDFYAVRQTMRMSAEPLDQRIGEVASSKVRKVEEVLDSFREQIPPPIYRAISKEVREAVRASETEAEAAVKQMGLLGALATAGIAALAYEHEANKQISELEDLAARLRRGKPSDSEEITKALERWVLQARQTRSLFAPLNDQENRERRTRFRAAALLREVYNNIRPLIGSIDFDSDGVAEGLRLPSGTFAEWSAVFQNVFVNAANAMLDADRKAISVQSGTARGRTLIVVEDTGSGVDLEDSEPLFQPFTRRLEISAERRELGLGGMGLGLAIVRMVANNLGCRVRFAEPSRGYSTAFELSWREESH